jgi:phospholipid/cholesterol/gamma-HCH transport system substrate-binding protein
VLDMSLDPVTFQAVTRLSIDPAYKLPVDSSISIVSDGLLGGKYASIEPGGADEVIEPGGEIQYTQSSILLEQLIGKFVFDDTKAPAEPEPPPTP